MAAAPTRKRYQGAPPPQDYRLEVARGLVTGIGRVRKFGFNADIATSWEDVWDGGGNYSGFLTVADEVRVAAGGNAADAAGGAGARGITVVGLDDNWEPASETVATAGASASALTTTKFVRVFRSYVADQDDAVGGGVGVANTANTGDITIETEGGTTVAIIKAGLGQTQMAIYTIPAGREGYLKSVAVQADATKAIDFRMFRREDADQTVAPFGPLRLITQFSGISEAGRVYTSFPGALSAKTDIICRAQATAATAGVNVEFDVNLVEL